jgi:hypothetical protein
MRAIRAARSLLAQESEFSKLADEGSFLLPVGVNTSDFFTWDELNRLINYSGVTRNLLRDGSRTDNAETKEILAALQNGATLQLENIELFSPHMAEVCGQLTVMLGNAAIRCNVYLAPSSEHVGFRAHHDVVDAFMVQISGRKRWKVWEPLIEHPVWVMKEHVQDVSGRDPLIDVTLEPGSVLFLRRGDPHLAQCVGDEPSLHLTIGIHRVTAQDVLDWLIQETKQVGKFRRSWPWHKEAPGIDGSQVQWMNTLLHDLQEWLSSKSASSWLDAFKNHRAATRRVPGVVYAPGMVSARFAEVAPSSKVVLSHPMLPARVSKHTLYGLRKEIELPAPFVPLAQWLVSHPLQAISVGELSGEYELPVQQVCQFIEELLELGFVRIQE